MKVVQGGEGVAVPGPFTPGSAGYDPSLLKTNGFSIAAAKAGISAHCATKSATAVVQPNPPGTQQSLEIIQKDLASAGFTLNLQPQDSATFVTNLHAGKTQVAMYPTVNPFLSLTALTTNRGFSPLSDNYWWGTAGAPAQYVQAAQQALNAVTPAQISAAAKAFNTALVSAAWGEGVYTLANHWVLAKNVTGFQANPADMIELGNTSVG
jgi:ABC-type transport system substrate-binding protein